MKSTLNLDAYKKFIVILIEKQLRFDYKQCYKNAIIRKDLELQIRHILPKHEGGDEKENNKVICTNFDHQQAHRIRFETYKNGYDKAAYVLISGQNKAGRQALL